MILSPDFHISIIKNLKPVKTFIEAKNFEVESDIKNEIEKTTGISDFKKQYDLIKKDYEEKLAQYKKINKTEIYDKIEKQINEIDDLEWENSKGKFKDKKEFNEFKNSKVKELKKQLKEIEEYRDKNEDEIERAEEDMEKAKKAFENAQDELEDKEEKARDILKDREGEFLNEIYHDIAKIEPILTEKFNKLFLETQVKKLIAEYISFLSSYKAQKDAGNIYQSRLEIIEGIPQSTTKIILPPVTLDFNVKEENSEIKKNLFSEVFVDIIKSTPNLKSPWIMSKIFSMADSWLVEKIANSRLKEYNFTYSSGLLKSDEITVSGKNALILEKTMIALSLARWLPHITIAFLIIIFALIIISSSDIKHGAKSAALILNLSCGLASIVAIMIILISLVPGIFVPEAYENPVIYNFFLRTSTVIAVFIFGPLAGLFLLLSLSGGIIAKLLQAKK